MKRTFLLFIMLAVVGHAMALTKEKAGTGVRIVHDDGTIDPGRNFLYTKPDPSAATCSCVQ